MTLAIPDRNINEYNAKLVVGVEQLFRNNGEYERIILLITKIVTMFPFPEQLKI